MIKEFTTSFHGKEYHGIIELIIAARFLGGEKTPPEGGKAWNEEVDFVKILTDVAHEMAPLIEKRINEKLGNIIKEENIGGSGPLR